MKLWTIICGFLFTFLCIPSVFAVSQSPVGNWVTLDERTGEKRAVITLTEVGDVVHGVIDKTYPKPGDTGICDECPGAFKGKKIQGLRFLWDLKKEGDNEWGGGSILDPKSGKIYRVKATLEDNKLHVRGYLGISLIGRTQIWIREQ